MRKTHNLIGYKDHIFVEGIKGFFSWIVELNEDNEFEVSTEYGQRFKPLDSFGYPSFATLRQALDCIGYEEGVII